MNKATTALLERLELTNLNPEQREKILKQFSQVLTQRISFRIFDSLNPDQQTKFDELQKKGDSQAVNEFIVKTIPNLDDLAREETNKLVEETKKEVTAVKAKLVK